MSLVTRVIHGQGNSRSSSTFISSLPVITCMFSGLVKLRGL